jgi:hypothetical protein
MKTREETIKALSEALATIAQVEKQILDLLKDVVADVGVIWNEPSQEPVVINHRIARADQSPDGKPIGKRGPLPGSKHTVGLQRRLQLYEDDLRRLHAKGLHITGMAEEIGLHRDTVSYYLKELGLTPNKAKGKNMRRGRVVPLAPTEREQNENLKQNPWETSNDAG